MGYIVRIALTSLPKSIPVIPDISCSELKPFLVDEIPQDYTYTNGEKDQGNEIAVEEE